MNEAKGNSRSNINVIGVDSIRINGSIISQLPLAESINAANQIPLARDDERQNAIAAIISSYPTQKVSAISARIREAQSNIKRISTMRDTQQTMINDYTITVRMCGVRDKELSMLYPDEGEERSAKIREWNMTLANADTAAYIVYDNMEAFQNQIHQCEAAIEKAEMVIEREREDISGMEKLSGQIVARDIELRRLGVVQEK